MKGLIFMASRGAFPTLRLISPALLRLLQRGGGQRARPRAPRLFFPMLGYLPPAVQGPLRRAERFFHKVERFSRSSRELKKSSSVMQRIIHGGAERQASFWKHSKESRRHLKESFLQGGKGQGLHLRDKFVSTYLSKWASLGEKITLSTQARRESLKQSSTLREGNYWKKASSQSLLRDALFDKKESRRHVNASFLRESMREYFINPRERRGDISPSASGAKTVHIGTVHIEGAQIRDFESFKRELSSAVEEL